MRIAVCPSVETLRQSLESSYTSHQGLDGNTALRVVSDVSGQVVLTSTLNEVLQAVSEQAAPTAPVELVEQTEQLKQAEEAEPEQVKALEEETGVLHSLDEQLEAGLPEIDRIWRGLTREQLDQAQRSRFTPQARAVSAFVAMQKAETEGLRSLGSDERLSLAGFRGWGGIASEVRADNKIAWKNNEGNKIAAALGMESGEYNRLMLSNRLESYYTPAPLIGSLWDVLKQAGVPADGRYLEPGCGAGHTFAGAPEDIQRHARLVGVECDAMAVRLAKVVAPDAAIIHKPYEQAVLDRNFDAVIGNVPFGETLISDSRYPQASHIHDYFIIRSLDHLKEGRVLAVITSSGTMDKKDPVIRNQMMERANLLAAFRLPAQVFADQGASVTTDILVLQKRPEGTQADFDYSPTGTLRLANGDDQLEFAVNQYFLDHPEHVLGDFKVVSSAFGPKLQVRYGEDLPALEVSERIAETLVDLTKAAIPEPVVDRSEWPRSTTNASDEAVHTDIESAIQLESYDGLIGDYAIVDGKFIEVLDIVNQFDDNGVLVGTRHVASDIQFNSRQQAVLRSYIPLRDSARRLIQAQQGDDDAALSTVQAETLALYETFVTAHGPINPRPAELPTPEATTQAAGSGQHTGVCRRRS
ncbi:hypothetical protein SSTU70S_05755 [Stutzerimonas stutzeri]